ncbi:MAG: hypothetical protein K9J30_14685 [Bacteroidales bacterium]|nr:hypothetical protein [Bacteroidales bacterium]
MELKHTIQILTKDIQEIEKLVRNLNKYPSPPRIELDLAMAKLRNVYELLSLISADTTDELIKAESIEAGPVTEKRPSEEKKIEDAKEMEETEKKDTKEEIPNKAAEKSAGPPQEPVSDSEGERESKTDGSVSTSGEKEPEEKQSPPDAEEEPGKTSILAEKFTKDKSINEKIASMTGEKTSGKYTGEPIDSIRRNIGINDRFLIIRELMSGDNEEYNRLINTLDECSNFNEAFNHIQNRFPKHLEHEGVKVLVNLARRKFISRGNV